MVTILMAIPLGLVAAVIVAWMAGALYFDVAQGKKIGWLMIGGWLTLAAATWYFSPHPLVAFLVLVALFAGFWRWWRSLKPSHNRHWHPNFAQLPQIEIVGDQITAQSVRNTEYRSVDDFDTKFETRTFWLSRLRSVDVLIRYWDSNLMSHPIYVFDFGQDGRLCISMEARHRDGQAFSFWRSLYRQYELMYVVSDERDAILGCTQATTNNDLHLYRVFGTRSEMRQLFLDYVSQINHLIEHPRWYHGVTSNCVSGMYTPSRGQFRWDTRMLLNGGLDDWLYERGRLDQSIRFRDLKRLSRLNEPASHAPPNGFGDFIRQKLPGYQFEQNEHTPNTAVTDAELPWSINDLVLLNAVSSDSREVANKTASSREPLRRIKRPESVVAQHSRPQELSTSTQ